MTILTDLMPPAFSVETMTQFSTGTGQPGTQTYSSTDYFAGNPSMGLSSGLLMVNAGPPKLMRYMGAIPAVPGRYIRVTLIVRLLATPFCDVRVGLSAFASDGTAVSIGKLPLTKVRTTAKSFELSAVIGTGNRPGVDAVLPSNAAEFFAGIDMLAVDGSNSQLIVNEFRIEDVSAIYDVDSSATVDVRDFGAIGNGTHDSTAAFMAADAAANGRTVLVPPGNYRLTGDVAFENPALFQGTVDLPEDKVLLLKKNFDLAAYANAFGGNEEGFKRAIGAMFNGVGHRDLDLCGRVIYVTEPINMLTASRRLTRTSYERMRIFNGSFEPADKLSPVWTPKVITITGDYIATDPSISNVSNVDQVEVGMVITPGEGVGREVAVRLTSNTQQKLWLSLPLYGAPGRRSYTLTRYRYFLEFADFQELHRLELENIEFRGYNKASGVLMPLGRRARFGRCMFRDVGHRAITVPFDQNGLEIEGCHFDTQEGRFLTEDIIAINSSGNDIKVRDCLGANFTHFMINAGQNALFVGNHIFRGSAGYKTRTAGVVLTHKSPRATISGNYIDNCFIEWTNEHDRDPTIGFPFGSMTITSNNFLVSNVGSAFAFLVIKPLSDFPLQGLTVSDNNFSAFPSSEPIERVEKVDETHGRLTSYAGVTFSNNNYFAVTARTMNPCIREHNQATAQSTWVVDYQHDLPFGIGPKHLDAVVAGGRITNGANGHVWAMPQCDFGGAESEMRLYWPEAVKGRVVVTARIDNADGR